LFFWQDFVGQDGILSYNCLRFKRASLLKVKFSFFLQKSVGQDGILSYNCLRFKRARSISLNKENQKLEY